MLERRRQLGQQGGRTPNDVVATTKAYSQRLKDKPVRVKLHVSPGRIADGTIGLESTEGSPAQLVVQAQGSNLFGLVKREIRHVFKVGELERSRSTHTAFLLRSIKSLAKGKEAMKEELLAKSLSLVRENEAVDLTFATESECNKLGDWIDAKWSVAMIQKSFRGNPRIKMALEGKNQTLNDEGMYEALERSGDARSRGRAQDEVDGAGFGRLPTLDAAAKSRLQDDLLDGVHVTHHDLSLRGFLSTSTARRLRFDCRSKAGLVYLEPSFEGDGQTIVQPISSLIQVGGGPSAHGPTSSLLRATGDCKEQRATAVSLVFSKRSMDITCGSKKNAVELVLFFSEVKGFTRAKPPDRSILGVSPSEEAARGGGGGGAGTGPGPGAVVHSAGAAALNAVDVDDVLDRSAPPVAFRRKKAAAAAASEAADPLGMSAPTFSARFRSGYGGGGGGGGGGDGAQGDAGAASLEKQHSAASGFGASDSLREIYAFAAKTAAASGVAQKQRVWATTHRETASSSSSSSAASAFAPALIAAGAPAFHSTPGPAARRYTMGATPASLERSSAGGQPGRKRAEGAGRKLEPGGRSQEQQQQQHQGRTTRQRAPTDHPPPPPPYRSPPDYVDTLTRPACDGDERSGAGGGAKSFTAAAPAATAAADPDRRRRHKAAVGELPGRRGTEATAESVGTAAAAAEPGLSSLRSRSRSPASRNRPKEAAAESSRRRSTPADTTRGSAAAVSHPRGAALPRAPPPLPAREGDGGGEGPGGDGFGGSDRHRHRASLHTVFPARGRGPGGAGAGSGDGAGAGAATADGSERGRNGISGRRSLSPTRQPPPPPFSDAAGMRASTSVAERAGSNAGSNNMDGSSRSGGAGGRRGRLHSSPGRSGRLGLGLGGVENDESHTTIHAKARTPSPTSSAVDTSGRYGSRRASTPNPERPGQRIPGGGSGGGAGDQRRSSATINDHRLLRKAPGLGLGKALRGKLFASSKGVSQGSSGSETPSSASVSPVPGRGGGSGGVVGTTKFGSVDPSSIGGARGRVAAFLSSSRGSMKMGGVGGVEGFPTTPSAVAIRASRFQSTPGASSEATRQARSRPHAP